MNPYNDSLLKNTWQTIAFQNHFRPTATPGLPDMPLLYPPFALMFFVPFALIPYRIACLMWWAMLMLSVVGYCLVLPRIFNRRLSGKSSLVKSLEVALLLLAFKTSLMILVCGQPCWIFFFASIGALWANQRKHPLLSGIMLGLAAIKINLALPIYLVMCFRKSWKTLSIALIMLLITSSIFFVLLPRPLEAFNSYFAQVSHFQNARLLTNHVSYSFSQLSALFAAFTILQENHVQLLTICLLCMFFICTGILYLKKKRPSEIELLFLSFFAISLCTYVQYYDFVYLVGLGYFYIFTLGSKFHRTVLFVVNVQFFIPIVGIVLKFNMPMNFFAKIVVANLPLLAIANFSLLFYYVLTGKTRIDFRGAAV